MTRNIKNLLLVIVILILPAILHGQALRVLVNLVNFADDRSQPYTREYAQAEMQRVDAYFREVSYGQTSFDFDVRDWRTLPINKSCDIWAIKDVTGTETGFDRVIYAFPPACDFPGTTRGTEIWTQSIWLETVGHELGHTFGLAHSASIDCGANVLGSQCTYIDYGDKFDLMGPGMPFHFNAFQKAKLGWLTPQIVTASGTYRLAPLETSPSALKVGQFYIEYRRPIGFDAGLSSYTQQSVIVHIGSDTSYLLDMTPATASWYDAFLTSSFTDPSGISMTVVSQDENGADIAISMPLPSPTPILCKKFNARGKCIK